MEQTTNFTARREPGNKGKLVGQKAPLRVKDIWAIRVRLQLAERTRELALFNLAVDSKLRSGGTQVRRSSPPITRKSAWELPSGTEAFGPDPGG